MSVTCTPKVKNRFYKQQNYFEKMMGDHVRVVSFINRNANNCASYHIFLGIAVLLIDDLIRSKENVRTVD